jgi:hypothetical protein
MEHRVDCQADGPRSNRSEAIIRGALLSLAWVCTLLAPPLARADAVADWNRIALDAVVQSHQRLEHQLNTMATVNVAMFEALNFVRGRYRPRFVVGSPGIQGLSADAVAAAAAHHILANSYPNQRAALDAALSVSLDRLPADHAKASSLVEGASIAAGIWALMSLEGGAGGPSKERTAFTKDDRNARALATRAYWPGSGNALQAEGSGSLANPLSWNSIVTELIAARALGADQAARIHALASMVAAEAYLTASDSIDRCAPCIAAASVAYVLDSELGAEAAEGETFDVDRETGRAIARSALREYYRPVDEP